MNKVYYVNTNIVVVVVVYYTYIWLYVCIIFQYKLVLANIDKIIYINLVCIFYRGRIQII